MDSAKALVEMFERKIKAKINEQWTIDNYMNFENEKGVNIMAKTTNLYIRVEPEVKEQAENILEKLGIPVSNAVNMFLKQVIMQNGIPFDVKLYESKPLEMEALSETQLNDELEKGYSDYLQEKTKPAVNAFKEIRKDYNI